MNPAKTIIIFFLLLFTHVAFAQTGPWAKYDQELKDGALYREASSGNLLEVKSIVEGGGNIHVRMKQTNTTILMAAAGSGKIEVVRYLLEKGADPLAKDWWDQTALDKARSVGAKDIEALLSSALQVKVTKPEVVKVEEPNAPGKGGEILKPIPVSAAKEANWPHFGTYGVGDSIIYWVPTGWRKGIIKEVGIQKPTGRISVDYSYKKYLVDPDAYALGNDWYEWTGVVRGERKPFWTSWFMGTWLIGEVTAHHNEVKNGQEKDTYYYMDASESLQVHPNGTYTWKRLDKKVVSGKWIPAKDQPGIMLLKGYRGFDWTLRNHTSVEDLSIRKLDIIELKPSALVGSIKGKRKTTL